MKVRTKVYSLALLTSCFAGCSSTTASTFAPAFDKKSSSYLTQPVPMVTATEDQLQPSISKSNHQLVYAARVAGNLDIYLKSASQADAASRLTEHSTDDTSPVFSPDAQSIIWVSKRADVKGDLWIMNRKGGAQRKLTTRDTADSSPVFHPDGEHVFFTSKSKRARRPGIRKLNLSSMHSELVEKNGWDPTISADGSTMVYVAMEPGEGLPRLYQRNLETGSTRPMTQTVYAEGLPTFVMRPTGVEELVFVRFVDDINGDGSIDANDTPSLWSIPYHREPQSAGPPPPARPLTPVMDGEIFVRPGDAWLVYTAAGIGDLDIFALPFDGMLSPQLDPKMLLSAATTEPQPALRRFMLRHIIATAPELSAQAYTLLAAEYVHVGSTALAIRILNKARELNNDKVGAWLLTLDIKELELRLELGNDTMVRTEAVRKKLAEVYSTLGQVRAVKDAGLNKRASLLKATVERVQGDTLSAFRIWQSLSDDPEIPAQWRAKSILGLTELALEVGDFAAAQKLVTRLSTPSYAAESFIREKAINRWLKAVVGQSLTNPYGALETIVQEHQSRPVIALRAAILQAEQQRKQDNPQSAQRRLQNLADTWPDAGMIVQEVLEKLADAAIANGDFDASLHALGQLLEKFPSHRASTRKARQVISRISLGEAEEAERKGNKELARKLYRRLIKTANANATAHRRYITLCSETGEIKSALRFYLAAVKENPRDRFARYGLGMVLTYVATRNFDPAKKQLEQALTLYPRFPEAHLAIGWIRMQLDRSQPGEGLLEQAIESFQTAKDLVDPETNPELWGALELNEGNALMALGKTDAAFAAFLKREQTGFPFRNPLRELLFREQFGRAAMHEEVWDVALDMTQTALELSQTLPGNPRRLDLTSRLAGIEMMLGNYQTAEQLFAQSLDGTNLSIKRQLALMRGQARARILQGHSQGALAIFAEALEIIRANQEALNADSEKLPWFYTEVPGNPEDVTAAIRGFNSQQESLLVHSGLAEIAKERGRFESALQYATQARQTLQETLEDSSTGVRIRLELLFALNTEAQLQAMNTDYEKAALLWARALRLSQSLKLSDKTLVILKSLQALSVRTGVARNQNSLWIGSAERELKREGLSEKTRQGFSRFLVLAYSRQALGVTPKLAKPQSSEVLQSLMELTQRGEASISAEQHEKLTGTDSPEVSDLFKKLGTEPVSLKEEITNFLSDQPSAARTNKHRHLFNRAYQTLSAEQDATLLYQLGEKWRLLNLPSPLSSDALYYSTDHHLVLGKLKTQQIASSQEVLSKLGPQEALLQLVKGPQQQPLWIWHHQAHTMVSKALGALPTWLARAKVQRVYLDIASAEPQSRQSTMNQLQAIPKLQMVYVASATWFVLNKNIRAIAQGLALSVEEDRTNMGMTATGITIGLEDLAEHRSLHPVVELQLSVRKDAPRGRFSELQIVLGNNPLHLVTLQDLVAYSLRSQVVLVNNAPDAPELRQTIAMHLHLSGAVAVIFPSSVQQSKELMSRLQDAGSLGLSAALLSIPGLSVYGAPALEAHQVVTEAVAAFNVAFRKGLQAFKAATKSKSEKDWAAAGGHFETLLTTLNVLTTREAKRLLKDSSLMPELAGKARLQKIARVLPTQGVELQLVARDKLSNIRAAQGNYPEAIALRELLTAAYASRGEHQRAAKSMQEQGNVYLTHGEPDKAARSFQECAAFSALAKIPKQEARCLTRSARTLNRGGQPGLARKDYEKAISIFRAINSDEEISTRRSLGHLYESSLSDYDTAEKIFKQALSMAQEREKPKQIRSLQLDFIRLLYTKGQYDKAMEALTAAMAKQENLSAAEKLTLRLEIAKVAWYQGNYAKARQEQTHALEIALEFGWTFQEIQARSLGGLIAMNLGDLDTARISMMDALGLAKRTGRLSEVAIQANNLGNVLRERGQYEEAIEYYETALDIEDRAKNLEGRAYALRNMGLTYARMDQPEKAQT
ncbi:MAG: tetratricopeptide repeat protein, partial [Deltaproteobacteria bacterium]|nr:tetratricopeptide repeat protein [Deltaproteobacteria bacterium]